MIPLAAFGLATAFGPGLAPIEQALAEGNEPLYRRKDLIGSDFTGQLCAFAPDADLAGVAVRVGAPIGAALHDLVAQMARADLTWPGNAALVALLPAADAGLAPEQAQALGRQVLEMLTASGWRGPQTPVQLLHGGAGTTALALALAAACAAQGQPALLIAADSHACRDRLNALLAKGGLFSKATPWGFVPGEAACAALFAPRGAAGTAQFWLTGWAEAQEPVPEPLAQDSTFTGLSDAALAALAQHAEFDLDPPAQVLTDWNNSRYRASEFSYAMVRLAGLLAAEGIEPDHPAHRFGQCGAGWLAAVLATLGAPAPHLAPPLAAGSTLILCGNAQDGTRGAFTLCSPSQASSDDQVPRLRLGA